MATLIEPVQLGSLLLANRVFMAPLTRTRADDNGVQANLRRPTMRNQLIDACFSH